MDPALQEASQKIAASIDHLKKELASIRAGRANPALVEELPVTVYGSQMKILEVGTISTPQPTLLTIQVWDPSVVKDVEKAILESSLGLNPATDGQLIRIAIPPLTQERREEFIKVAHQKGEEARVSIRQVRHEQREAWQKQKVSGDISEDESLRFEKMLQELVDKSSALIDELVKSKEADLMTI